MDVEPHHLDVVLADLMTDIVRFFCHYGLITQLENPFDCLVARAGWHAGRDLLKDKDTARGLACCKPFTAHNQPNF